jgi:SAM-dependent methyltransferase
MLGACVGEPSYAVATGAAATRLRAMRVSSAVRHPRLWRYERIRLRVAQDSIAGHGIEVGALHSPFPVPRTARVEYVDHLNTAQLRAEYPELADQPLVDVDRVDDGERLATVPDRSQDFVIASHFLEHCEDPVRTLEAHLRVLRPGGVLLLALPDRHHGIDRHRDATTLEHLVADHEQGPEASRTGHYREWARLVDLPLGNISADDVEAHAAALQERHYSIHFHCWTADEFREQVQTIIERFRLPARIASQRTNHHEFLVTLQRTV